MLDITLLGTGGVMPLADRGLTALYVKWEGHALLIDCGEGTQMAIRRAGLRTSQIAAILLTHYHADHIYGLPGLLRTMGHLGRTEPLTVYGPWGLDATIGGMLSLMGKLPFPVKLKTLGSGVLNRFDCQGLHITSIPLDHGTPCLGYRMELPRGRRFLPEKAQELGIPRELWSRLQNGESVGGFAPDAVMGPHRKGLKVLYATDTRPVPSLVRLGKEADLMVLEGMFGQTEKEERAFVSCHMTMQQAAQIAKEAGAARLWLTHYSPATPHPEEFTQAVQDIFPEAVISTDGYRETIRFPKEATEEGETKLD